MGGVSWDRANSLTSSRTSESGELTVRRQENGLLSWRAALAPTMYSGPLRQNFFVPRCQVGRRGWAGFSPWSEPMMSAAIMARKSDMHCSMTWLFHIDKGTYLTRLGDGASVSLRPVV